MNQNSIRIVTTRTLSLCLAVIALPLAAFAQPSPSNRGKRYGWTIGVGNPNAAAANSMAFKDFTLPASIAHTAVWCTDINPSGVVCGYFIDPEGGFNGFVGSGYNYTIFPEMTPYGIADDGTIAGYDDAQGTFIYKDGVTTIIPNTTYRSITQQGTVLYYDNFEMRDYTWKDGVSTLVSYPTPPEGVYRLGGWSLNSKGDMLVWLDFPGRSELYRLTNGVYVQMPPLPLSPGFSSNGVSAATLLDNGAVLFTIVETGIDPTGTFAFGSYKSYLLQEGNTYTRLYGPGDPNGLRDMTAVNGSVNPDGRPFITGVYANIDGIYKPYLAGPREANF